MDGVADEKRDNILFGNLERLFSGWDGMAAAGG